MRERAIFYALRGLGFIRSSENMEIKLESSKETGVLEQQPDLNNHTQSSLMRS